MSINSEQMKLFFAAAHRFLEAAPWAIFRQEMPLGVDTADREEACLVVLGEEAEERGFMLFETIDDYLDFLDAADEGGAPMGPFLFCSFQPRGEVAEPVRLVAEAGGVAWADTVPVLLAVDAQGEERALDSQDYLVAAACAHAIGDLLEAHPSVDSDEAEIHTSSSHEGLPEIELTLPHPAFAGAEDELIEGFLEEEAGRDEPEGLAELVAMHALRFKEVSEADALVWSAAEVEEYLLLYVPREVAAGVDELERIPLIFGRLMEFIGTEYETMDSRRTRRLIDHVEELLGRYRLAIADAARWGPAKRVAMRALERGIDPEDDRAMAAVVAEVNAEGKPVLRAEAKPGRNDACPCGSGKKHKKCCGG